MQVAVTGLSVPLPSKIVDLTRYGTRGFVRPLSKGQSSSTNTSVPLKALINAKTRILRAPSLKHLTIIEG